MESERVDRLDEYLREGRLIRGAWRSERDGRETACLLVTLAPEVEDSPSQCPEDVMPAWLSELTPAMDDKGTREAWGPMVRRYAAVARRWRILDAAGWRRALLGSLRAILLETQPHNPSVVDLVLALLDREISGGIVAADEWAAASAAVRAARAAASAAARAARAAASAAAGEAAWAAWAASAAAGEAAWDRITAGILSVIEAECEAAETDSAGREPPQNVKFG